MHCSICAHPNTHKHGKTSKGSQRYRCPACHRTFTENVHTLLYRRQVSPEQVSRVLQARAEGTSLRGISRLTKLAYGTVVSIVRAASDRCQKSENLLEALPLEEGYVREGGASNL